MAIPIPAPKVAVILQIRVTIDPKDRETFLHHFKTVYDFVVAEPECAYFLIGEDTQEPGVFRWTEGWTKDAQWFMSVRIYIVEWTEGYDP
jgi:quinol monooxygenase YgiN